MIDDLSTGSIENIEHLRGNPHFHYQIASMMDVPLVAELVDRCDVIFHLAAAVGVRLIVESPVRTIETNVRGTAIILELAAKKKKLVLMASTSEVYGKSTKIPFCEEDDLVMGATVKGRWSYACSKSIDEFLALAYWKERRLPVVVVRLFNTVGPRQTGRYGMVLPNFVNQAMSERPITIFGNGMQSRCFCYVEDIVGAMRELVSTESTVGHVFNIGGAEEIRIKDLAERVRQVFGSSSPLVYIPYESAYEEGFEDMARRVPSIEKIRRYINYRPKATLDEIIVKIVEHQKGRFCVGASARLT